MQMHTIPQNVSAYQDKIVGALIGRQFVYIAIGGIIAFVIYTSQIGPAFVRIFLAAPVVLFSIALALLRINEVPFDQLFFSYAKVILGPTEWTWGKETAIPDQLDFLIEPDLTTIPSVKSSQTDQAQIKLRQARHVRTVMESRRQNLLDEDEMRYIDQLDFSVAVPSTVIKNTDSNQPAPPMLTPQNFQTHLDQAPKTTPAKVTFTSTNPTLALAGVGSNRRQYIAADNQVVARSLSRPLAVPAKLPIRGEHTIALSPETQQALSQITSYQAAQAAVPNSLMSGTPQLQNDITNTMSTDPQTAPNQPTSPIDGTSQTQPTQGYEAPFGQAKPTEPSSAIPPAPTQTQPLDAGRLTLDATKEDTVSYTKDNPTPVYNGATTTQVSSTDATNIEQALTELNAAADQLQDPSSEQTIAKFDKFSAPVVPTVDINLNSTIAPAAQDFNLQDNSQFAPLPVTPVLPVGQTLPEPLPPTPSNSEVVAPSLPPTPTPSTPAPSTPPTNDSSIKIVDHSATPTIATKQIELTTEPNIINGRVIDNQGQSVPGVIIVVKDDQGESKRALKTNKLGQFIVTTPLSNGTYTVEVDKKGFSFDIIQVELTGKVIPLIEIHAK